MDAELNEKRPHDARPGIVVVFSGGLPALRALPLDRGVLVLGRSSDLGLAMPDSRMSREHASFTFDGERWSIRDRGSNHGTFVDGTIVRGEVTLARPRCIRMGQTIVVPRNDVTPFLAPRPINNGTSVIGPTLRVAMDTAQRALATHGALLLSGERGVGKEIIARAIFEATKPAMRFVVANCAAMPATAAERLLFGAEREGRSGEGPTFEPGYAQSADGGVLFLDEFAALDASAQGPLLKLLATGMVKPVGATTEQRVNVRVCLSTDRDLKAEVAAGRFQAELVERLSKAEVRLPALRERPEEIPWLIASEIARLRAGLSPSAELIESCILRDWPGNVREVLADLRRAMPQARSSRGKVLLPQHFAPVGPGLASTRTGAARREPRVA